MANLAKTGVVLVDRWTEGGMNGRKFLAKRLTLTLAAMGTAANKIEASVLGFRSISDVSPLVKSDNAQIIPACPSADGSQILLKAAATAAPADATGIFTCVVRGREL